MNKADARLILRQQLERQVTRPFEELLTLLGSREEFSGPGYEGTIQALWDDPAQKQLRLWAELSYSTWSSFVPVVECELIAAP